MARSAGSQGTDDHTDGDSQMRSELWWSCDTILQLHSVLDYRPLAPELRTFPPNTPQLLPMLASGAALHYHGG